MSRSASRAWVAFCIVGIALWVGATVLAGMLDADPADGRAVLLTFAAGGAAFFGIVFAVAWLATRPRADPELDALLAELALQAGGDAGRARRIGAMRRTARAYIALGALVTALGLAAIVQEGLGVGSPRSTLYAMVGIVVCWALAVPVVLRRAQRASATVLAPLGLSQEGATLAGERHGRQVRVRIDARGSVTTLTSPVALPSLEGDELLAYAGRGDRRRWDGVVATADGSRITIRRRGHEDAAWLLDLWLAERLAGDSGP